MSALVYHAGGLGDLVLSVPAVHRSVQAFPGLSWRFWGPRERLPLLPGFAPAPGALLRSGHTLWGDEPAAEALACLEACQVVLAFGGRSPPAWAQGRRGVLGLSSFPTPGGDRVPVHQAHQLDRLGLPRVRESWLPGWRSRVLPRREPAEILLHPGSGDAKKNLPGPTWEGVVGLLRRDASLPVRLLLGPVEEERGGWGPLVRAADGVTRCESLAQLVASLGRAALFLGNDAGATHLAGLLGVPTVAVFGPTDPRLWRPLGRAVGVVAPGAHCAPCTAGGPIACLEPWCRAWPDAQPIARCALALLGSP